MPPDPTMRRFASRPRTPHAAIERSAHASQLATHHIPPCSPSQIVPWYSLASTLKQSRSRRRRPTRAAAFAAQAAILVSSILVSSPAMIAPAAAQSVSHFASRAPPAAAAPQHNLPRAVSYLDPENAPFPRDAQPVASSSQPSRYMDDIDDHLPPDHRSDTPSHRQYARQYDEGAALFGERDVSTTSNPHELETSATAASMSPAWQHVTQSAHRYSLPSSYPSSIASSWSRPERSVWFQQKAIIITSIFLAIFIVLFIGAAVFLRERKFDDELAGLDDEEALARIEERMTMGRFNDPSEKPAGSVGGKIKRRLRLGRKRSEKDSVDPDSTEPSTGSSSALRRKRFLVSRWTRTRDSNDTVRSSNDAASIRSGRSARRVALGDPAASETVEVTYDSGETGGDRANLGSSDTAISGRDASSAYGSATVNDETHASDVLANRPRSPPPPHPDSAHSNDTSPTAMSSSGQPANGSSLASGASVHSPRRAFLDDSDFQAADAAETHHDDLRLPPAYISSGSGGLQSSSYDAGVLAAAIARGDAKHGIPPPAERDASVPPEVFSAALAESSGGDRAADGSAGPTAAHIATDDKALLGALSAAASMPSAPAGADAFAGASSAPAYAAPDEDGAAGSSSAGAQRAAGLSPTAPELEADAEGFEVMPDEGDDAQDAGVEGKGKAKQTPVAASSLLPAPPTAVEPAFSPFDQPYRATRPPGAQVPSSPPTAPMRVSSAPGSEPVSARKSEKQKEAEEEQMAQLVASRPETDVPRYERQPSSGFVASAPPLPDTEEADGAEEGPTRSGPRARNAEFLPAYERGRASARPSAPTAPEAPSAPPASSAPSAPEVAEDERDDE